MIQERSHIRSSSLYSTVVTLFFGFGGIDETYEDLLERRSRLPAAERKPLVLVADDEVVIRDTILEILRCEGYDALGVQDGMEAVECAGKLEPDVFVADVSMPRMNGIEAARQIKQLAPGTHVICFSGHAATSELLAQARKEGNDFEFLAKPIRPETLIRVIQDKVRNSS